MLQVMEAPEATEPTTAPAPVTMEKPTVLLSLKISKPSNRRKGDMSRIETDAEKDALGLSKELLDSPELIAIDKEDGRFKKWLCKKSLPSMFRAGVYRLPLEMLTKVDDALQRFSSDRAALVDIFTRAYPERIQEARDRLRSQFRPEDYPDAEAIRKAFSVQWSYLTATTPTEIGSISREIYERERIKAQELAQAEAEECRFALRSLFAQLVEHMTDRLTPSEDGKPKVFRDSLVKNFQEFLGDCSARNVTGDRELDALVRKAQDLTAGLDAAYLRKAEGVRDAVRDGLERMKPALDAMLTDKPTRFIELD